MIKSEETKAKKRSILKELIYEMRSGKPIYYRDYDKVLSGEKTLEEVMGSSYLHAVILMIMLDFLFKKLKPKEYLILTGEMGFSFAPRSWYNLDIAIYKKGDVKKIEDKYTKVPPRLVIEIDTKADLRKFKNPQDYFHRKIQDLLDSGVGKVIWIFTKDKKIWVAEPNKPWIIIDWDKDIDLIENIKFNLKELIEKENIEL